MDVRTIGEILDDLRGDFPDISVSKIRFLESQGLVNPERSPSGYRQFTDADLARLRWILGQQRDHYLPLKVIRRRLKDGAGPDREIDGSMTAPSPAPARVAAATVVVEEARIKLPDPSLLAEDRVRLVPDPPATETALAGTAVRAQTSELWPDGEAASYGAADIRRESGLDDRAMSELESFGLLPPAGNDGYGPEALRVAVTAAAFFAYGVEARHLRMYKRAAEQEAAVLSQVAMPIMNAKDPGAGARAAETLTELSRLGAALRLSLLRVEIGASPSGPSGAAPRR